MDAQSASPGGEGLQDSTLQLILDQFKRLEEGQRHLERKFENLTAAQSSGLGAGFVPGSTSAFSPGSPPTLAGYNSHSYYAVPTSVRSHRGSLGASGGGIDALNEARRNSRPETPGMPSGRNSHSLLSSPTPPGIDNTTLDPSSPGALPRLASTASPLVPAAAPSGSQTPKEANERHGDHPEVPGLDGLQLEGAAAEASSLSRIDPAKLAKKDLYPKRVVLTTYPGQPGVNPYPLKWGAGPTARDRGPIICSRLPSSLPLRNAIGALGGPYSIYRSLSIAMRVLPADFRPDFRSTEPPFEIPSNENWFLETADGPNKGFPKIVSMDPWGAVAQTAFAEEYSKGIDIRPTISMTLAHVKIPEIDLLYREGKLKPDGKIIVPSPELPAFPGVDQGIEIACSKAAVDPVFHLPGVAHRLGVEEALLRRALFEETGGSHPELLTRPDLVTYLPPIGGQTVYIFGDPAKLTDPNVELTARFHDECSGSDVFGSDICTCRPYLIYGIEEAVKCAQRGGVGLIVYFRKEGRALGEVTKYLVYNLRKRSGDSAERYFKSTEMIAGVKDQRMQSLALKDICLWLGIKRIHNLISMSDMKHDAIVSAGVEVLKRYEIPEELMPPDSMVEIRAKIAAGYYSSKAVTEEALKQVKGRQWEDVEH